MIVKTRTKRDSDTDALEQIFGMNRSSEAHWFGPERPADHLASMSDGEVIIVAESESEILGFISVWEPERFIHHLYVHRGHHGKGIGKALVAEVGRRYPGELSLKCVKANQRALDFYLNAGWQEVSTGDGPEGEYVLLKHKGTALGPRE